MTALFDVNASQELIEITNDLFTAREMKKAAMEMEEEALNKLKPEVNRLCDEWPVANGKLLLSPAWGVSRTKGTSKTIKAELLMAKGVAPDVIAECTVETNYYKYQVLSKKDIDAKMEKDKNKKQAGADGNGGEAG